MKTKSIPKIKDLRKVCQPSYKFQETIFLAYFIRSFSIYFSRIFILLKISANQTSVLSLFFGLIGSALVMMMTPLYVFFGSLCLIIHTILDFVDGEVARYTNNGTLTGKYLDDVNHSINVPLLMFFVSFGLYQETDNILIFFLGALAAVCEAIGHNVEWGYRNRLLYSELKKNITSYSLSKNHEIKFYNSNLSVTGFKYRFGSFISRVSNNIFKITIIKKLYDKLWFENRIVNFVILIGLSAPLLDYFQLNGIYIKTLSFIIIIYGINRPIIVLQNYMTNIIFKNSLIETEINEALKKLQDL